MDQTAITRDPLFSSIVNVRNGLSYKNMERFMVEWRHWLMDFEYLISTPKFVYSQSDPDPEFILSSIFLTRSLMDNGF